MKTIIKETEENIEDKLLGKNITFISCRYIYNGDVVCIDDKNIVLQNTKIVYETGSFSEKEFKDAQKIQQLMDDSSAWYLKVEAIESYGRMK